MSEARYREEQYSEMIEKLEEDLEFLKAEVMITAYAISNDIESKNNNVNDGMQVRP